MNPFPPLPFPLLLLLLLLLILLLLLFPSLFMTAVSIVTFESSSDVPLMVCKDEPTSDSQMAHDSAVLGSSRWRGAAEAVRSLAVCSAAWQNLQALCLALTCVLLLVARAIFESVSNYILCFLFATDLIKATLVWDLLLTICFSWKNACPNWNRGKVEATMW